MICMNKFYARSLSSVAFPASRGAVISLRKQTIIRTTPIIDRAKISPDSRVYVILKKNVERVTRCVVRSFESPRDSLSSRGVLQLRDLFTDADDSRSLEKTVERSRTGWRLAHQHLIELESLRGLTSDHVVATNKSAAFECARALIRRVVSVCDDILSNLLL